METNDETIRGLRERIEFLEEENRQLRQEALNVDGTFANILTRQQSALLMNMYKKGVSSYVSLDRTTEEYGKYNRYEGETQITTRTKVAIWKLRQKLRPYGIEIKVWRNIGYYIDDENKAKLRALMEKKDGPDRT